MPSSVVWSGFDRLQARLERLISIDADMMPLMEQWGQFIVEGNRRGVLAGLDGNNKPMPAVKYRFGIGKSTRNRRVWRTGYGSKTGAGFGEKLHETTGAGPYATGLHDNLTWSQYRELTGPRLAPRGEESRVIKNLETEIQHFPGSGRWEVIGAWYDVVDRKGRKFLHYHFDGEGHLPKYDLRPVRPEDYLFARNALDAFLREQRFINF